MMQVLLVMAIAQMRTAAIAPMGMVVNSFGWFSWTGVLVEVVFKEEVVMTSFLGASGK
jgi:hypothetical protein